MMSRKTSKHKGVPAAINSGDADSDELRDQFRDETADSAKPAPPREIGGRDGPDPTRFGDWEKAGRCIDF